jgi:hypothetical protein
LHQIPPDFYDKLITNEHLSNEKIGKTTKQANKTKQKQTNLDVTKRDE